jgi:ketopantoate reductase
MNKGIDMTNGYNNLVTLLAARTADALGVTLGTKLVDKLIREATEIVVMDWCEFDYDKDAEWLDLIASVEAGSSYGEDLVEAVESQMNFMGTLGAVLKVARKAA